MRSLVSSNRVRFLSRAALIAIMAGMTGACSSDFTRFDRDLYAEALPRSDARFRRGTDDPNAYPDDVDRMTTASISSGGANPEGAPIPLDNVSTPRTAPDHGSFQPLDRARERISQVREGRRPLRDANRTSSYQSADASRSGVVRNDLPSPERLPDPVTTGSVRSAQDVIPADDVTARQQLAAVDNAPDVPRAAPRVEAPRSPESYASGAGGEGGWTGVGGTRISMRSGETLYNLSKRYGVPVREIMRVNDISDASQVQAGQSIVIPTYVYSHSNPVSAPDADSNTMAARASTGLIGQPRNGNVAIPTPSPLRMAAVQTTQDQDNPDADRRYRPKPFAVDPDREREVPDYSITTGSVSGGGTYTVVSGDTLSRIASRNGTSVSALQAANGLSGTNIRVGQKLKIPAGNQVASAAADVPAGVDPVVTGSNTSSGSGPKPYVRPQIDPVESGSVDASAPERTGIEAFRWPVQGRVISRFGEKRGSATNDGIDISVPEGTAVKATENGVVIYSGSELEGFGNLILIRHADGYVSAYAHNRSNEVKKGDQVRRGQIIARSGRSGNASVPMLHFELRKDSKPVDPLTRLNG